MPNYEFAISFAPSGAYGLIAPDRSSYGRITARRQYPKFESSRLRGFTAHTYPVFTVNQVDGALVSQYPRGLDSLASRAF